MKFGKLAAITIALNMTVIALAIVAWSGSSAKGGITTFSVAGLLAILAFSMMWVHYLSEAIKDTWFPDEDTGWQYPLTRWFVLFAIVVHPLLLTTYFALNHYGWPPGSYEAFFGSPKYLFVYLGYVGLAAFFAFEINRQYQKRHWNRYVFHANILAMFLILIHGFRLGTVTNYGWYYAVWWLYGGIFTLLALRLYMRYYTMMSGRKILAVTVVLLLALTAGIVAFSVKPKQPAASSAVSQMPNSTSPTNQPATKKVTMAELEKNNGQNGALCWLAIDGTVYDVTGNSQWQNGQHIPSNGLASCGRDLTDVIGQSPHGKNVLGQLETIGQLE